MLLACCEIISHDFITIRLDYKNTKIKIEKLDIRCYRFYKNSKEKFLGLILLSRSSSDQSNFFFLTLNSWSLYWTSISCGFFLVINILFNYDLNNVQQNLKISVNCFLCHRKYESHDTLYLLWKILYGLFFFRFLLLCYNRFLWNFFLVSLGK